MHLPTSTWLDPRNSCCVSGLQSKVLQSCVVWKQYQRILYSRLTMKSYTTHRNACWFFPYPFYSTLSISDLTIDAFFYLTMWGLSLFLLSAVFLRYALNYAAVPRQLTCKDHLKTLHTGTWLRAEGRCIMLSKSTGQWDKSSSMNNGFFAASR